MAMRCGLAYKLGQSADEDGYPLTVAGYLDFVVLSVGRFDSFETEHLRPTIDVKFSSQRDCFVARFLAMTETE